MKGQISVKEIKRVSVDGFGGDVRILPADGDELLYDIGEGLELQYEIKEDTLFLKVRGKGILGIPFLGIGKNNGDIALYIPQDRSLDLNLKSGDISFSNYRGDEVSLKAASGDIDVKGLSCNYFQGHLTSGDIDIDMETKRGLLNFRSGDVRIYLRGENWNVDISGVSGDVDVDTETNSVELQIKGVSGDVSVNNERIGVGRLGSKHLVTDGGRNKLSINVISGDVSIKIGKGTGEIKLIPKTQTTQEETAISSEDDKNISYIPEEVKKIRDMYRAGRISKEDAISLIEAMGYGGLSNILEE